MSQIAYIIQRIPKNKRTFVELEKSTGYFYLTREEAESALKSDPVLVEFFRVYEVEVDFSEDQIIDLKPDYQTEEGQP